MPIPDVGWGARDTSGLSHEQIHRWVHDGADPVALADARDRHAARGSELRAAGRRLEAARGALVEGWAGRDADAAGSRVRALSDRMVRLGDDLAGQARGLDGMRVALERVRAAVGPPRPAVLDPLVGARGLAGLPSAAAGLPADGFAAFHSAHADEVAARAAYRTYLEETAASARAAPAVLDAARAPGTGSCAPHTTGSGGPEARGTGPSGAGTLARAARAGGAGRPVPPVTTGTGATPTRAVTEPVAGSAAATTSTRPASPSGAVPIGRGGPGRAGSPARAWGPSGPTEPGRPTRAGPSSASDARPPDRGRPPARGLLERVAAVLRGRGGTRPTPAIRDPERRRSEEPTTGTPPTPFPSPAGGRGVLGVSAPLDPPPEPTWGPPRQRPRYLVEADGVDADAGDADAPAFVAPPVLGGDPGGEPR